MRRVPYIIGNDKLREKETTMTENSVPEPLVPQDKLKHIELTEEQLKEISGGGTATGWGYTYGDKWHASAPSAIRRPISRAFTPGASTS